VEYNEQILRWLLIFGAAPIWFPFLKALWDDFNSTLAEEGGLFGETPSLRERERIEKEKAKQPDVLVSEPWTRRETRTPIQLVGFGKKRRRRSGFR